MQWIELKFQMQQLLIVSLAREGILCKGMALIAMGRRGRENSALSHEKHSTN